MSCKKSHTMQCPRTFRNIKPATTVSKQCPQNGDEECFEASPPRTTEDQFAKKQQEILTRLPEELRGAVSYLAYEQSHAYGYDEIFITLKDMVDHLEEPVKKLIVNVVTP